MLKPRLAALLLALLILTSCRPASQTATLALLGDLMLARGVNPTPASLSYLAPQLQAADLSLANLESPLSAALPDSDSSYNLCASSGRARLLSDWGLDLLSIANNHSFDCGPDGQAGTSSILAAAGIHPVGPGPEPVYREVNGLKLAFLAFDDISSPLEVPLAARAVRSARATGALVIVSIHWGMEYQGGPSERQKTLAAQFANAGAVLVVGAHPHVLQPAAWIQTSRGKTLVLYSLGNALFDQPGLPDTRQSALVLLTLDAHGVRSMQVTPFVIDEMESRVMAPDAATAGKIRKTLLLP
jgi:poly-gamma-glutamate capsule biosynthesis protein CapA/YwtB (metallophosphatase superfamily)